MISVSAAVSLVCCAFVPAATLHLRLRRAVCECAFNPGRDIPDLFYSVHFSCMNYMEKPGDYATEHDFMKDLYTIATSCSRHYFLIWCVV